MTDLTKLADALELKGQSWQELKDREEACREAARILRAAGAADVGGLMAMHDAAVVAEADYILSCGQSSSEAAKELRALLATQAQGQDAAPAEQPQDDEPTWQELEDFRKRHWTHWNAADNLLIAHLAQKLKCAARAKE